MNAKLQEEIDKLSVIQKCHIYEPTITAVAEASFKAGQAEQQEEAYDLGWKNGNKAGIREVVGWIKEHQIGNEFSAISIPRFTYLTRLKEWGIVK